MAAVKQDARKDSLAVNMKIVLWEWPRGLLGPVEGVSSLCRGGAPWVCYRTAGIEPLGADRSAASLSEAIHRVIARSVSSEEELKAAAQRVRFLVTDGASDELAAAGFAQQKLPHLDFHMIDESHSAMLLLKKCLKADPEVAKTEELLVSGKESVSKLLTTSGVAKSLLQGAQMSDAVGVLHSFSWAMQRFDSRKKPLARVCQRLGQCFTTLAKIADVKDDESVETASRLLQELTGPNCSRLVLAGLMADLVFEHSAFVHSTAAATLHR